MNDYRWSLNPVNPLDINYDPDSDGWFDRQSLRYSSITGTLGGETIHRIFSEALAGHTTTTFQIG